jgi:hypothetical protein
VQQAFSWARQNSTVVAVICGAALVMYGFYRGSVRIMRFFFNVSDKQIFNIGFVGGMVAAAFIVGAGVLANRRITTNVDSVYRAALQELRKYDAVKGALGEAWGASGFKGYKVESLRDAMHGSERRERASYFEAPAPRVQMIFLVKGIERNGMVSLEAFKRNGEYHFSLLSLDLKAVPERDLPAEHLFLAGSTDTILFREVSEILEATRNSGRPELEMEDEDIAGEAA